MFGRIGPLAAIEESLRESCPGFRSKFHRLPSETLKFAFHIGILVPDAGDSRRESGCVSRLPALRGDFFHEGSKIAGGVDESDDAHIGRRDAVNQAVLAADDQFPDCRISILTNKSAARWELAQTDRCLVGSDSKTGGVARRIPGKELDSFCQSDGRRFGPLYFASHFANRCCTSS